MIRSAAVLFLFCVAICSFSAVSAYEANRAVRIAILGGGGRSQHLLLECLKINKDIKVVAICDENGLAAHNFFCEKLKAQHQISTCTALQACFKDTAVYPDTEDGLQQFCRNHSGVDWIFITSSNYRHQAHLTSVLEYSPVKNRNTIEYGSYSYV